MLQLLWPFGMAGWTTSLVDSGFWQSPAWLRLLHFPSLPANGPSRIDGGTFFLSPRGHIDPAAEGEAFVEALLAEQAGSTGEEAPLACRFPARFRLVQPWLEQTGIELTPPVCPELDQWLKTLAPRGLTLVFAEAYLNNPASMFGHSFLRVESGQFRSPLLQPSIGFAARTDQERGLEYAFKGIFGGYTGRYSLGWYGDMVRQYGATENRDLWEYHLNFSEEETRTLLLHLREVLQAEFRYFFLDENCSFQLLALMEAIRPELHLTAGFPLWAIPTDTVRIIRAQGLVQQVGYRPSRQTILQAREAEMTPGERKLALALCEAPPDSSINLEVADARQASILELAADCLLYQNRKKSETGLSQGLDRLLRTRSDLNVSTQLPLVPTPPVSPDQGHGSSRVRLSAGVEASKPYVELDYRAALHGFSDDVSGYVEGAKIQLVAPQLRLYPAEDRLQLEQFTLVDVVSAVPGSTMIHPLSWSGQLALTRIDFPDEGRQLTGLGSIGIGKATHIDPWLAYGLLQAELLVGDNISKGFDLASGIEVGLIGQPWPSCSLSFSGKVRHSIVDQSQTRYELEIGLTRNLRQDTAIFTEAGIWREFDDDHWFAQVGWAIYF